MKSTRFLKLWAVLILLLISLCLLYVVMCRIGDNRPLAPTLSPTHPADTTVYTDLIDRNLLNEEV